MSSIEGPKNTQSTGKIILCDVDDVIADLVPAWLDLYNCDYEDSLTSSDITGWNMLEFVDPACGVKIYDYLEEPSLYQSVKPIEGAQEGVKSLRGMGHRVIFITACSGPLMAQGKIEWLFRHEFLDESDHRSMHDLILAKSKGLITGDIMIDDYYVNCNAFKGESLLFDKTYNKDADCPRSTRVRGWDEIVEFFEGWDQR